MTGESRDANGMAGDHDATYEFGGHWSHIDFAPFTIWQYCRLLTYRSRVQAGLSGGGDLASEPYPVLVPVDADPSICPGEDPSTFGPSD
jgi:hypothetical protein